MVTQKIWDMQWISWLRQGSRSRKVTVSSPDGASGISATGICYRLNPSSQTMALGSTRPDRNENQEYFLGGRSSRCLEQTTLPPYGFGGLVVSMLSSGSRVRGFKPDRSRWIFSDVKKSSACLPSEGK
jgi:hypothetical protein